MGVSQQVWRVAPHRAFLGLGSNLGDRHLQMQRAVAALKKYTTVEACSSLYDTAPMLVVDQPRFLNLVCLIRTHRSPVQLLRLCKSLERNLGRVSGPRFGPRDIDIDLLFYDDLVLDAPTLTVPHPRIAERAFVLLPLAEIAPDFRHPVLSQDIASLARGVDCADVVKLGPLFSETC